MGSSTLTTATKHEPLPPDWRPGCSINLAMDQPAHAHWCALFDIEGEDYSLAVLRATKWWLEEDGALMERLVRYGLLAEVKGQGGGLLGWHRTEKGRAWAIETCFGAWMAGFVKTKDAPRWFLEWVVTNEPGCAHTAQKELARRAAKRVRR